APRCSCVFPFQVTVLEHSAVSRPCDADGDRLAINDGLHLPGYGGAENPPAVMLVFLPQGRWQLDSQKGRNRQAVAHFQIDRKPRPVLVENDKPGAFRPRSDCRSQSFRCELGAALHPGVIDDPETVPQMLEQCSV